MLKDEIHQRPPFSSLEEKTYLNLQRTAGLLAQSLTRELKTYRLTPSQYNALRILRGAYPGALTCGEVGERMVTPEPDVTRLIDRLVDRQLVDRQRDARDRRVVRLSLAENSLDLLAELDHTVESWLREHLSHLGDERLEELSQLLESARCKI